MELKIVFIVYALFISCAKGVNKRREDKTKCPKVSPIRNFELERVSA